MGPLPILGAATAAALALVAASPARAQNTSGVSSPEVEAGDVSLGYRIAFAPSHDGSPAALAQRLHIQRALNDSLRLRLLGTVQNRGGDAIDFSSVGAEARWQIIESERHGWDGGLIFQIAVPTSPGRPERFKLGIPASVDITERWRAGAVFYTGFEFGEANRAGALLEARAETTYEIVDGIRVGPQWFADMNTSSAPGRFDEQDHQAGFVVKGDFAPGLSFETGALFGVSEAAADIDLRLFLSYAF